MRRMFTLAALLALSTTALAVPMEMGHQGRLFDSAGVPLDGSHTLTFTLYDAASSGNDLWSETVTASLDGGYFSVTLGQVEALDADLFDGSLRYLAVTVDSGTEIPDRLALVSVPYAVRAGSAATADSATVADSVAGGTANVTELQVGGATVIDTDGDYVGRIDWSQLDNVPSTTDNDTLAGLGCTTDEIARHDGSQWVCTTLTAADVGAAPADGAGGVVVGTSSATCRSATAGTLRWNTADNALEVCDGADWSSLETVGFADVVVQDGAYQWGDGAYASACWEYRTPPDGREEATVSGVYRIDPDGSGSGSPFEVYCDMQTDGGGWTLVDNDATDAATFTSRQAGANADISVTRGSYLPAYTWSGAPQLLCKASRYNGSQPWVTFNALTNTAREYPTQTTQTASHAGHWSAGNLNGNTNHGVTSWIYNGSGRFGSVWIGAGNNSTCSCNYTGANTGLGTYGPANSSTCSTWVR